MSETEQAGDAMAADVAKVAASQTSFAARIRNYFLTGLVVAGPLAITVWLVWSIITWVDDFVRPMIPPTYRPESYMPWPIPGTGLIIAFVVLTLLGFLTANLVGRTLVELGESLLSRMPIVRPIYKTMKQIFESLFSKTGSSFRKVALVEFPAPGMWSLVFLSQPPGGDVVKKLPQGEHVSAFMPCTPTSVPITYCALAINPAQKVATAGPNPNVRKIVLMHARRTSAAPSKATGSVKNRNTP
jgi:uncharacterized membrane protein